MNDQDSASIEWGQILLRIVALVAILLTAFFLLDMKWLAMPFYLMRALLCTVFGVTF